MHKQSMRSRDRETGACRDQLNERPQPGRMGNCRDDLNARAIPIHQPLADRHVQRRRTPSRSPSRPSASTLLLSWCVPCRQGIVGAGAQGFLLSLRDVLERRTDIIPGRSVGGENAREDNLGTARVYSVEPSCRACGGACRLGNRIHSAVGVDTRNFC